VLRLCLLSGKIKESSDEIAELQDTLQKVLDITPFGNICLKRNVRLKSPKYNAKHSKLSVDSGVLSTPPSILASNAMFASRTRSNAMPSIRTFRQHSLQPQRSPQKSRFKRKALQQRRFASS